MEHRDNSRKHLFLYLDIIDRQSKQLLGHLGDISDGGLMIITSKPIPLHQVKYLRIMLPKGEFSVEHIDVKVETRWQKPDLNPDLNCVGCQYLYVEPDDQEIILKLGELLSFEG